MLGKDAHVMENYDPNDTPRPGLEPGSKAPEASRMSTTLPRHVPWSSNVLPRIQGNPFPAEDHLHMNSAEGIKILWNHEDDRYRVSRYGEYKVGSLCTDISI